MWVVVDWYLTCGLGRDDELFEHSLDGGGGSFFLLCLVSIVGNPIQQRLCMAKAGCGCWLAIQILFCLRVGSYGNRGFDDTGSESPLLYATDSN